MYTNVQPKVEILTKLSCAQIFGNVIVLFLDCNKSSFIRNCFVVSLQLLKIAIYGAFTF